MTTATPYTLVKSFDENLWRLGLEGLAREQTPDAFRALLDLLGDKLWRKREAAAKVLIAMGDQVVPQTAAEITPDHLDQYYWGLFVLGHFDHPQSMLRLKEALQSNSPEIRGYGVRAVAMNHSLARAKLLYAFLQDSNWAVRKLAFEQLLRFGETILDDLRTILLAAKDEANHSVVALFAVIGGEKVMPELRTLYANFGFSMRYSIVTALTEVRTNQAMDFIISCLSDGSWVIRKKSAEALMSMGNRVYDRLLAAFSKGDSLSRYQIVDILVRQLRERSLALVQRLLASPDQEYRILAIESLTKIPGDEASRMLIKALRDPHRIVSDYASECLAQKANLNLDLLLENLNSEDENLRFMIMKTIGMIGGVALNPILRILETGSKEERSFLLGVLSRIQPNEQMLDTLLVLLGDPSWPIRNATANCLIAYGEVAVPHVVRLLNAPNEDVRFWSKRVLLALGGKAVASLTAFLEDGSDPSLAPHIVAALLSMDHADAVPAVVKYIGENDDSRVLSVFESIAEISSREIVDTLMNLLVHPDKRVVQWVAYLLRKVNSPNLRKIVLLGLGHPKEDLRLLIIQAMSYWAQLAESELKTLVRQLSVEQRRELVLGLFGIVGGYPVPLVIEATKQFLEKCEARLMLDTMLVVAAHERSEFEPILLDILSRRSAAIGQGEEERLGRLLGLLHKKKPEKIIEGLASESKTFRLCSLVALEAIDDKRIVFPLMDNLNVLDDVAIVHRAVKVLARFFFSEDFRVKGAVTDYLLGLNQVIVEPLIEVIESLENDLDRKALADLIESVGGKVDLSKVRRKGDQKIILSDEHLENVLERRRKALEDLEKYDEIIKTSHTQEVTIMFTDVKGYTAFSSKASLSDVMTMLKDHDDILVPVIQKHAGQVMKKIGDAFLVIFEEAQRAVLAGIEIQRALKEHNLTVPEERQLAVRVAINTGPVIRKEADVFGDAVNLCSRLEGVADAGEIVVSESTAAKINRQVFELASHGTHQLKGIERPVQAFLVRW